MILKEILEYIEPISVKRPPEVLGLRILGLCQDSRIADPTCLFFCRTGAVSDGHRFARQAYDRGARFFVVERDVDLPDDATVIKVKDSSYSLRRLSVIFYGDPAKDMRLIGITGTKGKTTVALSVYNIASECGINIGYIGTNGIYYNGKVLETANTTPDCLEMQKALRLMRDSGVTDVVIEVSSQALWQERTYGLSFDICAFTNLYEDHIGGVEHPNMEHYICSKKKLFTDYNAKNIVVNYDSPESLFMLEGISNAKIVTTSASGNESCDIFSKDPQKTKKGIRTGVSFRLFSGSCSPITIDEHGIEAFIPIPGSYSIENGLLTIAICSIMGLENERILNLLSSLSIAGRFEAVELESKPNTLFVIDYAHNGASLKAVLDSLREYNPYRIIVLFGSVGGRTFGRRAELGRAADEGADVIIVTSDNPNNEEPMDVINDIDVAIINRDREIYLIPDRAKAIEKAYEIAGEGDMVLLAGKGHETYQLISGERVPFSEKKILRKLDALNIAYT